MMACNTCLLLAFGIGSKSVDTENIESIERCRPGFAWPYKPGSKGSMVHDKTKYSK